MEHTKRDVEAMIYNMSAEILMGKATREDIEKVVKLAEEHNLLGLVGQEFGDITDTFAKATTQP